jgi:hypothetical protein
MIDAGTDNERTLSLVGGQIDIISSTVFQPHPSLR